MLFGNILPAIKSRFGEFPSNLIEGNCLCKRLRCQLCHIQTFGNDFGSADFPLHITAGQLI
jgi:hypothetical protein